MTIDKKEFIRSFVIRPDNAFNFFLGAGASVQANIPAAGTLIWQFKRRLYCDANNCREEKFKDLESERNRITIQSYFDLKGSYPKLYGPEEYSFYFKECYRQSIDRKSFIQRIVTEKNPSIGHKCLGVLFATDKIEHIWTTNFDELIENGIRSVNNSAHFETISPDNIHQINNLNKFKRVVKLHGDYRYDELQNTSEELKALERSIHDYFAQVQDKAGLIVVGYSGSDRSVMDAFEEVLKKDNPFPYGLYWCIRKGQCPSETIVNLIEKVNQKSKEKLSGVIEIDGFDEFLFELYTANGKPIDDIENIAKVRFDTRKAFISPQTSNSFSPIKLNGLKATSYPKSVLSFKSDLEGWKELRSITSEQPLVAALSKGNTLVFGNAEVINAVFEGRIKSEILTLDIDDHITYHQNSFFMGMMYDLIEYNLNKKISIKKDPYRRHKFYSPNSKLTKDELDGYKVYTQTSIYEAVEIQLEFHNKELFLTILPSIYIDDQDEPNRLKKQSYVNAITSNRRNNSVNDKERFWIGLFKNDEDKVLFEMDGFKIEFEPNYSSAGMVSKTHIFKGAFQNPEPFLNFNIADKNQRMTHPLKGLKKFSPLDHSFENPQSNRQSIKIAIISPMNGFEKIIRHLNGLNEEIAARSEKDYLIDYQPFSSIYKRYLEIPPSKDNRLVDIIEEAGVSAMNQNEFYDFLKRKIDYFYTIRGEFDVLVLYIPNFWAGFRELKNDNIYFDLHDSIKLFCAKKNIKIQFVEDKSIAYFDQAKVRWWLSLGIYVKANGTPWRNETISDSTAFIGLDFSINKINNTSKFVLGSSHIFDSTGQGLRFLLQPIDQPVFYGKNPFMSKEDARKLILKLKEAYFRVDGNSKLDKLVIHKVLHFTHDEMQGIAEALDGIENVELLQIQKYSNWRAIRGIKDDNTKKITIHGYPVQRGTVVQLDDYSFLLWTHGSVLDNDVAGTRKNYYQSSRGIPAPLLVRRFRGSDPIETTVKEILSLTKMNWNGGELYKTLPVTLDFSKRLARYAKQAETLNAVPYDFRFFM